MCEITFHCCKSVWLGKGFLSWYNKTKPWHLTLQTKQTHAAAAQRSFSYRTWTWQRAAIAFIAPGFSNTAAAANLLGDVISKRQRACSWWNWPVAWGPVVRYCLVRWEREVHHLYSNAPQEMPRKQNWAYNFKWRKQNNTYKHSGSWQHLTCSLVYMCTCSFLWCWDIQRSYKSQAAGTHWCLWKVGFVSFLVLQKRHEIFPKTNTFEFMLNHSNKLYTA